MKQYNGHYRTINVFKICKIILLYIIMENINYVDTIPEYIVNFVKYNEENIKKIIIDETKNRGNGIIFIDTDLSDNRLDLVFLTNEEAKETLKLTEEFIKKTEMEGKTSIIINDNEYKTRFIIYM